ncbi:MAG: hypothetical protein HC836_44745 [Richelia sp. RM2_1_2]|nr:hypothetical protein [Richelia sp. SM2_1_7]NJO64975.1 hypothetical protein [Richelia sp. RM2_1_2]
MIRFLDLTDAEFIYCWLVSRLDDWHHECFCNWLLIEKYDEVQAQWHCDNERIKKAQYLTINQVTKLQERLSKASSDSKWDFTRALNYLDY